MHMFFKKKKPIKQQPSLPTPPPPATTSSIVTLTNPPRILIIGAGSRGNAYARAISRSTNAIVAAVCEPIVFKRQELGRQYVWGQASTPRPEQEFGDWKDFVHYETTRRDREAAGEKVEAGVDAIIVCVLDELHVEVITGLAPLGLHILCEKPLATRLEDCVQVYKGLRTANGEHQKAVFGICHVLRYSSHNKLLRELVLKDEAVGEVISIEHTEPVGWWHFSHSYVRGNWRKTSTTAPSLLTKSCHDIDILLWLLCSPAQGSRRDPHLPSSVSSSGSLKYFRPERKPKRAGNATNCLSCPIEQECIFSAKKIYIDHQLHFGNTGWPVKIVNPEIEECFETLGRKAAEEKLAGNLAEDYTIDTPRSQIEERSWYGRCVWESDNDVCDDQHVTITWEDDPVFGDGEDELKGRGAKSASFHMIAFTEAICTRRGRIYGTKGEIEYDSTTIKVHDFDSGSTKTHRPHQEGGGHGGGDYGLARQFVLAVDAVKKGKMGVEEAQTVHLGCSLEEIIRSHAMVFAAEESRREGKALRWQDWWYHNVEVHL